MHIAVEIENVERVKILLKKGANRHIRNNEGRLPGRMPLFGYGVSKKKVSQILDLLAEFQN